MATIEAEFVINAYAGGWGNITGNIQDQTDLQNELNSISGGLSDSIIAVDNKYDSITGALNDSIVAVDDKFDSITGALDDKYDSITGALADSITAVDNKFDSITGGLDTRIDAIEEVIPSAASDTNQLADKNFVNSSIATNTANFIGTFNSVADLEAYSGTVTNNDYAFVVGTDAEGNTVYDRYKYTDATTPPSWQFEYELNNSSFTAAQWDAINSGITSGDVALIQTALQPNDNVSELNNDVGYITSASLPTVNDGELTIKVNGSSIATFTANASSNVTANITVPTDVSDLTNTTLADTELSNLSETGNNRLHALKAYADNGELLKDAEGLADVKKYAHSSFDLSKFTVSGTPNITSDGIASGFSSSNYLLYKVNWGIKNVQVIKFKVPTLPSSAVPLIVNTYMTLQLQYVSSSQKHFPQMRVNDGINNFSLRTSDINLQANTTYVAVFTYDCSTYQLGVYLYNEDWNLLDSKTQTSTYNIVFPTTETTLAVGYSDNSANLILDLKGMSTTVDNIPVFSGNKTGIDTIKDNDYTVVGTPTISADGIASVDKTNYVKTSITYNDIKDKSWKFTNFAYVNTNSQQAYILFDNSYRTLGSVLYSSGLKFCGKFGDSNDSTGEIYVANIGTLTSGWYYITISFDITTGTYTLTAQKAGSEQILSNSYTPTTTNKQLHSLNTKSGTTEIRVSCGNVDDTLNCDLNSFKIYVNGDLVYQPCLKIPYTLSKTGSKVVNDIYRDRVNDMATQFGYAPYYTLQEDKVDNYMVVGSPTISNDFVASGFSNSNYVVSNNTIDLSDARTWMVTVPVKYSQVSTDSNSFTLFNLTNAVNKNGFRIDIDTTGKLYVGIWSAISTNATNRFIHYTYANALSTNTQYYIKVEHTADASDNYIISISTDAVNYTVLQKYTQAETCNYSGNIFVGYNSTYAEIDLKKLVFYKNNKLAYEAVINPNFTLPQTEIYGNIQRTLRDSYRNGATYWELWSDRTLEIGGTCTSGVEYNLPRNFASATDYIVTIPYSAKTASSFTPTASGDFIAKGLGVL